jgi:hypothetical protein|tara:strand:+ start:225 stop:404 length:180 start_codon:yes stop_codon:yes gene_type:complete
MEDFLNLGGVPVRNLPILKFNPYNESANDDEAVDAKLSARSVTFEDIRPALNTFSPPPK